MSRSLKERVRKVGTDRAKEELIASTARLRAAGNRSGLASRLRDLAELERWRFDHAASIGHYEEVVSVLRGLDEPLRLGHALRHLGQVFQEFGDADQAEACYIEALDLPAGVAESAARLAILSSQRGHSDEVLEWLGRAKAAAEASGDQETIEYVNGVGEKLG